MHSRAGGNSQGRPEGGEAAELWPALLMAAPSEAEAGVQGGRLPFHHPVTLTLFLLVLALLACLQLALGLATLILGTEDPCVDQGHHLSLAPIADQVWVLCGPTPEGPPESSCRSKALAKGWATSSAGLGPEGVGVGDTC